VNRLIAFAFVSFGAGGGGANGVCTRRPLSS
jgi:hypothetical protein